MTPCPAPETLRAFAEGRLGGTEGAAVAAHLDACASCRQAVAPGGTRRRALVAAAVVALVGLTAALWALGVFDRAGKRARRRATSGGPRQVMDLKVLAQPEDKPRSPDVAFVPTPQTVVEEMLELAELGEDDVLFDLGCGDGRIVVTAAREYGCQAVGFEVDPGKVEQTRANIANAEVGALAHVRLRDVFTLDLSEATVVTIYLFPDLNRKLIPQLEKMRPGSRIVSYNYPIPGCKAVKVKKVRVGSGRRDIFLYTVPLEREE